MNKSRKATERRKIMKQGRLWDSVYAILKSMTMIKGEMVMQYECHIIVDFEFNPVYFANRNILHDEIIEIGAIKLNPQMEEIGRLTCLVKPELNPIIEPKITKLTGIRTEDVTEANDFKTALSILSDWVGCSHARIYSWSSNDLWQLVDECQTKGIYYPNNMYRWLDLQRVFQRIIRYPQSQCMALSYAADILCINFDKKNAHRAIYDTEVTAEILKRLKNSNYMADLENAKKTFCRTTQRMTYSIGSRCGDVLEELLAKLA